MSRRRVLLTGAAGFIGSQIARLLVKEGHDVFALIRPDADRWRIADIEPDLAIIEGDLNDLDALTPHLRTVRPDICLHFAWRGGLGQAEAEENLSALSLSLELLRTMYDVSCSRFASVGTCFEYDVREPRLSESTTLRPQKLYGACKKALFEVTQEFSALTGISTVTPRVFYAYGPYEDERRLVPSIVLSLLRDVPAPVTAGEQVRDYLHVEDVASAIWRVAASEVTGAVNIASGEPVTIAQVATRVGELLGRPELVRLGAIPYRIDEPMRVLGDPTLLRQTLCWEPRFALDQGLADTIEWWQARTRV